MVFCELSERKIREPLFYQMGVRESLGRCECVIAMEAAYLETILQLRAFSPQYDTLCYKVCGCAGLQRG